jgi:hypothetical protein
MAPVDVGEGNLSWHGTLEAVLSMIGENVTVNALSERTGKGVIWISGTLTDASDFESEFRQHYPDYTPTEDEGELLLVRVVDGPEESENGSGVMLREDEFESAGWFPPVSALSACCACCRVEPSFRSRAIPRCCGWA